jgi:DNA-binding transcriptional ArsR family regulator
MTMPLSATEVRILSELRRCKTGASPTHLAEKAQLPRPTLYVLLGRLQRRRMVTSTRVAPWTIYSATKKGLAARVAFAKQVGLKA